MALGNYAQRRQKKYLIKMNVFFLIKQTKTLILYTVKYFLLQAM